MKAINEYVECELNIFRNECNFSEEELLYFNLRAKNNSNIRIATEMNVSTSTIYRIKKSVLNKVETVEKKLMIE